jgi:hypothetical protein
MIAEAGLKIETMDFMPSVSVWIYQTFLKKTSQQSDRSMAARKDFQFYERFVYPVEHCVASLWKPMFANEFQFFCRKQGE